MTSTMAPNLIKKEHALSYTNEDTSELYLLPNTIGFNVATAMTTIAPCDSYLSDVPKSIGKYTRKADFFKMLGFKQGDASETMRIAFYADMEAHVQFPSHRFLNKEMNPEAFGTMMSEFLTEYGPKYWGDRKRDHLEEPDTLKGFMCPRDAQREDSR